MLYLGYRPTNTFEIHQKFYESGNKYPFYQFHLCKSQFLERFFKKYYSGYEFDSDRKVGNFFTISRNDWRGKDWTTKRVKSIATVTKVITNKIAQKPDIRLILLRRQSRRSILRRRRVPVTDQSGLKHSRPLQLLQLQVFYD